MSPTAEHAPLVESCNQSAIGAPLSPPNRGLMPLKDMHHIPCRHLKILRTVNDSENATRRSPCGLNPTDPESLNPDSLWYVLSSYKDTLLRTISPLKPHAAHCLQEETSLPWYIWWYISNDLLSTGTLSCKSCGWNCFSHVLTDGLHATEADQRQVKRINVRCVDKWAGGLFSNSQCMIAMHEGMNVLKVELHPLLYPP